MSDSVKKVLKILGVGVIWIYVLSIRIGGETLFHYANDVLVQNRIVEAIDHTLADGVDAVWNKAKLGFNGVTGNEKRF